MKFPDRQVKSISNLLRNLDEHNGEGRLIWFRGQSNIEWQLKPGIGRTKGSANLEMALIKRFKQNAVPHLTKNPTTEWEWLFLMQHHRLKTRLLDWSESPLAGLYFAVNENPDADGALWCLDPVALNKHANIEFENDSEIPAFDHDVILENYLPSTIIKETTSNLAPIAAIASRNSARIAAQLGVFTITHRSFTAIERAGDSKHIWRYKIPKDAKEKIRSELRHLRFTKLTLFPELDSVASDAEEFTQ